MPSRMGCGCVPFLHSSPPLNAPRTTDPRLTTTEVESLLDHLLDCTLDFVLCNARTADAPSAPGLGPSSSSPSSTTRSSSSSHQHGFPAPAAAPATRCYCWRLRQRHDFRAGGQARLTLSQHIDAPCARAPTFLYFLFSDLNAFNPMVATLAALYLALLAKALAASVGVFIRARRSFDAHAQAGTPHALTDRWVGRYTSVDAEVPPPRALLTLPPPTPNPITGTPAGPPSPGGSSAASSPRGSSSSSSAPPWPSPRRSSTSSSARTTPPRCSPTRYGWGQSVCMGTYMWVARLFIIEYNIYTGLRRRRLLPSVGLGAALP